jgi:hypothetical protein
MFLEARGQDTTPKGWPLRRPARHARVQVSETSRAVGSPPSGTCTVHRRSRTAESSARSAVRRAAAAQAAAVLRLAGTGRGHRRGLAQRAIDEILEQGEGPRGHWKDAHFGHLGDLDEFRQLSEASPGFDGPGSDPGQCQTVRARHHRPLATDPIARRVMDLFNVSYEILAMLRRFFAPPRRPIPSSALADLTSTMFGIRPRRPGHDAPGGGVPGPHRRAGFELFYESDYVPPHCEGGLGPAGRRIRRRRLLRARRPVPPVGDGWRVRASLTGIADALAVHLPNVRAPAEDPGPCW